MANATTPSSWAPLLRAGITPTAISAQLAHATAALSPHGDEIHARLAALTAPILAAHSKADVADEDGEPAPAEYTGSEVVRCELAISRALVTAVDAGLLADLGIRAASDLPRFGMRLEAEVDGLVWDNLRTLAAKFGWYVEICALQADLRAA